MENEAVQLACFQVIAAAGAAKADFMNAVEEAKEGKFESAEAFLHAGQKKMAESHRVHSSLIQMEMDGSAVPFSLILLHAEDQMMGAEQVLLLAEQVVELYRRIG